MYKMLRDSGLSVIGAALMTAYVTLIAGPMFSFADWYGRNYVGEQFDEDDFPTEYGPIATVPSTIPHNDLLDGPPTGSKEWEDWIDNMERTDLE